MSDDHLETTILHHKHGKLLLLFCSKNCLLALYENRMISTSNRSMQVMQYYEQQHDQQECIEGEIKGTQIPVFCSWSALFKVAR